jgi:hypothetical protein
MMLAMTRMMAAIGQRKSNRAIAREEHHIRGILKCVSAQASLAGLTGRILRARTSICEADDNPALALYDGDHQRINAYNKLHSGSCVLT